MPDLNNEHPLGVSKQIKEVKKPSKPDAEKESLTRVDENGNYVPMSNSKSKLKAAEKQLEMIKTSTDLLDEDITKLSSSMQKMLNPKEIAIPDTVGHTSTVSDKSVLDIFGNVNKKATYKAVINKAIEERMQAVTAYSTTGVYERVQEALYVDYLETCLPILTESSELFIDDVCNGVYRGPDDGRIQKFRFYDDNGALITDEPTKTKMINILNPQNLDTLISDKKSFDEIDTNSEFRAWKYGYSFTRVIPNKKIAMDLYLKYVLKKAKAKQAKKKALNTKGIKPVRENLMTRMSDLMSNESYIYDKGYFVPENFNKNTIKKLSQTDIAYEIEDITVCEGKILSDYEKKELALSDETFLEFVERYANGVALPLYETSEGFSFNFESSGYNSVVVLDVINQLDKMYKPSLSSDTFLSIESAALEKDMSGISFADIYASNIDLNRLLNEEDKVSMESTPIGAILSDLSSSAFNIHMESSAKNASLKVAQEVLSTEGNVTIKTDSTPSLDKKPIADAGADSNSKQPGPDLSKIEEMVKFDETNYNRVSKLFENIRGETVEYLENSRCIPIMAGNMCIGTFYIEYTHQDVEHYLGMRQLITSPMSTTNRSGNFAVNEEQAEETMGRVIFADVIKPLIEKNIDVKFIKNNTEILHALNRLLQDHEITYGSQVNKNTTELNNVYNMSKVIFIPIQELIFKRNTDSGLGESRYRKAATPANAYILANEAYQAYLLNGGGGFNIVKVPKGLSEVSQEEGQAPLFEQIMENRTTRMKLRDVILNNFELGPRTYYAVVDPQAADSSINVDRIEGTEFHIEPEVLNSWEEQATNIVGYNSALFSSKDGNVELATALFEINDSKMILVQKARRRKKVSSSKLATRLLRIRGGGMYDGYFVEWLEPPINRRNTVKRTEQLSEIKDAFNSYMEIADTVYEENDDYNAAKEEFKLKLLSTLAKDDSIVLGFEERLKEAVQTAKAKATAEKIQEKLEKADKKSSKKDDEEDKEDK